MARKTVARNISYDDQRKIYYVSMDLGKDENGKRMKRYQTYNSLYAARIGLRQFLMRREEICGLKWERVDYQRQLLFIREARTAFGATIVQAGATFS